MRIVLAAVLLASASFYLSFAQEQGKAPPEAPPQAVPAPPNQNSQQQWDQRTDRDRRDQDDRRVGRGWRMHPGDSDRRDRDDRMAGMTGRWVVT
jgi:hypothetical protein